MTLLKTDVMSQRVFWKCIKQPLIKNFGCTYVYTGIRSPWMNGVIAHDETPDFDGMNAFFESKNVPYSIWSESFLPSNEFQCILKEMELDLSTFSPKPSLNLQLVSDQKELDRFIHILIRAYEESTEIAPSLKALFTQGGLKTPIFHYIGENVTIGSMFIEGKTAYIFDIGTLPEKRNNGYANALMHSILHAAKEMGCENSILTSTPAAVSIYSSLGYKDLTDFNFFTIC